jgi:hypothetical protein
MALGVILMPQGYVPGTWNTEIAQTRGGNGTFLQPFDPFFNTRGERGWYYDTQMGDALGKIPTDAEVAKQYVTYTPVKAGWINASGPNRYIPSPWRFGWDPAGAYGPQTSLSGAPGFPWGGFVFLGLAGLAGWGVYRASKKKPKKRSKRA